jgi:hypothetical protein
MRVTRLAGGKYCAIEYVQGGEQRRGAMTNVVGGNAFDAAEINRQPSAAIGSMGCVRSSA